MSEPGDLIQEDEQSPVNRLPQSASQSECLVNCAGGGQPFVHNSGTIGGTQEDTSDNVLDAEFGGAASLKGTATVEPLECSDHKPTTPPGTNLEQGLSRSASPRDRIHTAESADAAGHCDSKPPSTVGSSGSSRLSSPSPTPKWMPQPDCPPSSCSSPLPPVLGASQTTSSIEVHQAEAYQQPASEWATTVPVQSRSGLRPTRSPRDAAQSASIYFSGAGPHSMSAQRQLHQLQQKQEQQQQQQLQQALPELTSMGAGNVWESGAHERSRSTSPYLRQRRPRFSLRWQSPSAQSHQRSQIGRQSESAKRSAPSYSFNRASPEDVAKLYLSPEASRTLIGCGYSPGPAAYSPHSARPPKGELQNSLSLPVLLGSPTTAAARMFTPATFGGTEARFAEQERGFHMHAQLPGPGQYRVAGESHHLSQHPGSSPVRIGTSQRVARLDRVHDMDFAGRDSPGPGFYSPPLSAATIATSPCTSPGTKFRTAARPLADVMTPEQRRAAVLPGPGQYAEQPTMSAILGQQRAASAFSFGHCDREFNAFFSSMDPLGAAHRQPRTAAAAAATPYIGNPGPAQYCLDVCSSSNHRHPAVTAFGGATRFQSVANTTPGPGTYVT